MGDDDTTQEEAVSVPIRGLFNLTIMITLTEQQFYALMFPSLSGNYLI